MVRALRKNEIELEFPADMEYIPLIRKLVSEIMTVNEFSPKYAYRAEIIADEICMNAVKFGSPRLESRIVFRCLVFPERVEMTIKDEGGAPENLARLRRVIETMDTEEVRPNDAKTRGRGLEIVRMLANGIDLKVDAQGLTEIHVIKYRQDTEGK